MYPKNAQELLASSYRGKDDFFLLCKFDAAASTIGIGAEFPIAVNKGDLRDAIARETGVKLPTRAEISKNNIPGDLSGAHDWNTFFTAAAGSALWVEAGHDDEPKILMMQNSLDKPVNPGRFNFPSGLLSDGIFETAFRETNEECGIFIVDSVEAGAQLTGLNFNLFPERAELTDEFRSKVFAARTQQEGNIRRELLKRFPGFAADPITWQVVQVETIAQDKKVVLDMPGQREVAEAHVFKDEKARSVNVHFPVRALLPGAVVISVDPEQFGRNTGFYSTAEAKGLEAIPAPRDYFINMP